MVELGFIMVVVLEVVWLLIKVGVMMFEFDMVVNCMIFVCGVEFNFQLVCGYSYIICIFVNEQVVYGILGECVFQLGDIVFVDCGVQFYGWNGDSVIMVVVFDLECLEVVVCCEEFLCVIEGFMWVGIVMMVFVLLIDEIGVVIQDYIEVQGLLVVFGEFYGIFCEYVGYGIGFKMYEVFSVFNYWILDCGEDVKFGFVFVIEFMVMVGGEVMFVEDDDWIVIMVDGMDGFYWEYSVVLYDGGIWVFIVFDGGRVGFVLFWVEF